MLQRESLSKCDLSGIAILTCPQEFVEKAYSYLQVKYKNSKFVIQTRP